MLNNGWIYYPRSCIPKDAVCRAHFVLHGCYGWSIDMLGEPWGKYGRMAAANNIILIFTEASKKDPACYDVWGYSGKDFATK